jgi:hypothetical protein
MTLDFQRPGIQQEEQIQKCQQRAAILSIRNDLQCMIGRTNDAATTQILNLLKWEGDVVSPAR